MVVTLLDRKCGLLSLSGSEVYAVHVQFGERHFLECGPSPFRGRDRPDSNRSLFVIAKFRWELREISAGVRGGQDARAMPRVPSPWTLRFKLHSHHNSIRLS